MVDVRTRVGVTPADLCRVTVVTPRARIDVALPADVPLADLLPTLLRRSGTDPIADAGPDIAAGGAWGLQRFGDQVLDGGRTAAEHGLHDGEVLHLRPRSAALPEPAYDDIADAVAGAVIERTRRWRPQDTRRAGLAAASLTLAVAALLVVRGGPPWAPLAVVAVVAAVVLLATGVSLSRAFGDARAGLVAAFAGVGAAGLAGVAALAGPGPAGWLTGPAVLGGCAAVLVVSVVAAFGVGDQMPPFVMLATAALLGLVAAALDVMTSTGAAGAAALAVVLALGLTPAVPMLAARLAELPQPVVPMSADDVRADRSVLVGAQVVARAVAADAYVTALVAGIAVVVAVGEVALARETGTAVRWLAALAALAALLRARVLDGRLQRVALLAAAGIGAVGVVTALASGRTGWERGLLVLLPLVVLAVGFVAVAVAVALPGRRMSPVLRRAADVLDGLTVASLVPVALQVLGVYRYVRGLGG